MTQNSRSQSVTGLLVFCGNSTAASLGRAVGLGCLKTYTDIEGSDLLTPDLQSF